MKLRDVFNDLQIDTLFERMDELIDPKKLVSLSFDISDEDKMVDYVKKIRKNTKNIFKEILLGYDGISFETNEYSLFKEIFDYYHRNFYKTVMDSTTFAILIPNITNEILENRRLVEVLEKNIFYAIKANPSLNCTYRTCIVRYNNNTSKIDIHFVHYDNPEQDRRYTLDEKTFEVESMKNGASATVCINIPILNGGRYNVMVKFVSNEAMERMNKQDHLLTKCSDEQLKIWNTKFDFEYKHIMYFDHWEGDNHEASGIILHNIHL